jgi:serine/threonine protein kinase
LKKYKPVKKLGEGSFGKVYKVVYNSQYYAIKFEDREEGQDLLQNEATIMSYLKGNPHIPKVRSYGFKGNYNILVMQLLDKSLEDIFNLRKKFSFKTGAMLAYQMISALEYIHEKHIIHRDIKPDNFVLGSGELNAYLYLVDFGLAKKYRSSKTLKQYPYIKKKKLTGTARYASIHAMEEMEQSRRDDLEAVGYVIMYFIRGNLPWQGLKLKSNEDRYKKILEKKKEVSTLELCSDCPRVFYEYVNYTKKLGYTEEPRYDLFKNKFVDFVVNQSKEKFDYIFDWTTESDIKIRKEVFDITCPPMDNYDNVLNLADDNDNENNKEEEEKKEENEDNENNSQNQKAETACCIIL